MRKLDIPANALLVAIGATLIFGYGMISSLISSSGSARNEGAGVQPTPTGNTTLTHSSTIRQ